MSQSIFTRERLLKYSASAVSKRVLLDLGCGDLKREGHIGVDKAPLKEIDIVCDLHEKLPFEDSCVDGIYSSFLFEHIGDTIRLFEELHRICVPDAEIEFRVPYYQSFTQYKDPTHKSIILPETISYFTRKPWYHSDYQINADFELLSVKYIYLPPFDLFVARRFFFLWPITRPLVAFCRRFLWNVVHSVTIKIKVRKN